MSATDRVLAELQAAIDEATVDLARLNAARAALLGGEPVPIVRPPAPDVPPPPVEVPKVPVQTPKRPAAHVAALGPICDACGKRCADTRGLGVHKRAVHHLAGENATRRLIAEPITRAPFDPDKAREAAADSITPRPIATAQAQAPTPFRAVPQAAPAPVGGWTPDRAREAIEAAG